MERKGNIKLRIVTGDTVKVMSGNDKGKQGKVLSVNTTKSTVIVEGVNVVTKHIKPSAENPEGGQQKTEAPIHISNLMLVDGSGNLTKVGRKRDENGKLVRFSKKSGEVI